MYSCQPWHLRLRHVSTTRLQKLKIVKSTFKSKSCPICKLAKQVRKRYRISESKAKVPLERIHSDICGQVPESIGNSVYNLLFLDEFTHYCWVYSIPDKSSETIKKAFLDFIKQIENITERKSSTFELIAVANTKANLPLSLNPSASSTNQLLPILINRTAKLNG